jgi:hypothetical protein
MLGAATASAKPGAARAAPAAPPTQTPPPHAHGGAHVAPEELTPAQLRDKVLRQARWRARGAVCGAPRAARAAPRALHTRRTRRRHEKRPLSPPQAALARRA